MYGSYDAMYVRYGTFYAFGGLTQRAERGSTECKHHGQNSVCEHTSIHHVHFTGKPSGGVRDSRCTRRADTDALHTDDPWALGARVADSLIARNARAQQHLQIELCICRCYQHHHASDHKRARPLANAVQFTVAKLGSASLRGARPLARRQRQRELLVRLAVAMSLHAMQLGFEDKLLT